MSKGKPHDAAQRTAPKIEISQDRSLAPHSGVGGENTSPGSDEPFVSPPHFHIDSTVVRQLGEELITDPEQALLELVKNSYDADATWCTIQILTGSQCKGIGADIDTVGRIVISDNGVGMTSDALQRGWLTISQSAKRTMKALGRRTALERTPLGDKGLGRLATMRLGDDLRITTYPAGSRQAFQLSFSWSDCKTGVSLFDVPIKFKEMPRDGESSGTSVEITSLKEPSYWEGADRTNQLRLNLSKMVSPFKTFQDFVVTLSINEKSIPLISYDDRFLQGAVSKFSSIWDGKNLELCGSIKMDLFSVRGDQGAYDMLLAHDSGKGFYDFLSTYDKLSGKNIQRAQENGWYISFSDIIKKSDLFSKSATFEVNDPGPLISEIFSFNLARYGNSDENVDAQLDFAADDVLLKRLARELAGVFIFRNNFRVRLGKDWLGLGEEQTTGKSYYSLRPANVLGYVSLTSADNPKLIETSDRESFVDTAEFRGFMLLMNRLRKFANESLEAFRRAYTAYKSQQASPIVSIDESFAKVIRTAKSARVVSDRITTRSKDEGAGFASIHSALVGAGEPTGSQNLEQAGAVILRIENDRIKQDASTRAVLEAIADSESLIASMQEKLRALDDQLVEAYEAAAVGVAAQGLVHEVHPFVEEVIGRIRGIEKTLRNFAGIPVKVFADLESVRANAVLIAKRMAYIEPMLRTFRETRTQINVVEFLKDLIEQRKDRLRSNGIDFDLNFSSQSLIVRMNRGRLTQVFDNLIRNSEYWLINSDIEADRKIVVEVEGAVVSVSDTGPGVRPAMEHVLFDMFTTDKPAGKGQGLGLFLCTQLLRTESCSIALSLDLNSRGRKYKFKINLSGAVVNL